MFKLTSKYLPILLLLALLAVLLTVLVFLYKNFYLTYIQAEEVLVLQQQVSPVVFKQKVWEKVNIGLDLKSQPLEPLPKPGDPFVFSR